MWRCANNPFLFCKDTPDWGKPPVEIEKKDKNHNVVGIDFSGGTCKLNPKTCGNSSSSIKEYPSTKGHYHHKIVQEVTDEAMSMIEQKKKKGTRIKTRKETDVVQGELL